MLTLKHTHENEVYSELFLSVEINAANNNMPWWTEGLWSIGTQLHKNVNIHEYLTYANIYAPHTHLV